MDLLYVLIPANSLTPVAARLKKRAEARLVLDLIDLWPESLPIKGLEWFWPVRCWRKLRDDYLAAADLVLTECGLYQQLLRMDGNPDIKRKSVMYWPKEREPEREPGFLPDSDRLHIGYIGSINHIIDMDLILEVLDKVNQKKPVVVHVTRRTLTKCILGYLHFHEDGSFVHHFGPFPEMKRGLKSNIVRVNAESADPLISRRILELNNLYDAIHNIVPKFD